MNELQLLQQAYSNGTITPQQAERLKQLMSVQGASPAMSRIQSMFQQPTKSYYDAEQGKWVEQGAEANYSLPNGQASPITQNSTPFQDLSIEDSIKYNAQPRTYLPQGYNTSRIVSEENRKAGDVLPTSATQIEEWKNNVTTGITDGTATEEQRMQYQDWAKGENDRLGYNKYDLNFGSTTGKSVDGSGALVDTTAEGEGMPKADMFRFPMINPGGSDLSTEIYSLGRALSTEKGTPGRGMNIVGAGGAAALDIARNLASGIGFSKRNQYVMDWYKKKQQERNYVPDSQSEDQNSTGGRRDGGTIGMKSGGTYGDPPPSDNIYYGPGDSEYDMRLSPLNMDILEMEDNLMREYKKNLIPDSEMNFMYNQWNRDAREGKVNTVQAKLGGTINMFAEDGMTMPEGQMQPQEQMLGGQDQQMQQVVQMIAGMLQQGANPQQVLEQLVQQGIPQQEAEKLIQMVVQQMQGQQAPAAEQPQDQQMVMKNGGTFDKRVGESVTIKVGGKKIKGVIKEIKNGQITLK